MISELQYLRFARTILLGLIPVTALLTWGGTLSVIDIKTFCIQLGCLLVLSVTSVYLYFRKFVNWQPALFPILVATYGIWMMVRFLFSQRSSFNAASFYPQICGVTVFLLFIAIVEKKDLNKVRGLIALSSFICSVYAILQFFNYDPITWIGNPVQYRVLSFFGNKNVLGIFLVLCIPLSLHSILLSTHKLVAAAFSANAVISFIALAVSGSRGALISFLAIGLGMTVLSKVRTDGTLFMLNKIRILFTLLFLGIATTLYFHADFGKLVEDAYSRSVIYRIDWEVIREHPLMGVGPGNFPQVHAHNRENWYIDGTTDGQPAILLDNAHNDTLATWIDYGLAGVLVFWGGMAALFIAARRRLTTSLPSQEALGIKLMSWSLGGYLLYGMVSEASRYTPAVFFFWIVAAMLHISLQPQSSAKQVREFVLPSKRILRFAILLLFLATLGSLAVTFTREFRAKIYLGEGELTKSEDMPAAISALSTAVSLDKRSVESWYALGYAWFSLGEFGKSIASYTRVQELAPDYMDVNHNLASCYYKQGEWERTIHYAQNSVDLYPNHLPSLIFLAYCHYYLSRPENSYYYVNRVLALDERNAKMIALKSKLSEILSRDRK